MQMTVPLMRAINTTSNMTVELWLILGFSLAFVVYIVLRFAFVWYFCGGKGGSSNYYSDSEK